MVDHDPAVRHGGDLAAAVARYGTGPEGWLDLSTGINPHPYPMPELPAEVWTRLPQADAEAELLEAAAGYYGVDGAAHIVAAPGTQALIQWLARLQHRADVAVVGPTYGEHAAQWRLAGHRVSEISDPEEGADAAVLIIVNPNNPDGRIIPRDAMLDLADRRAARGGLLIVDEAFADVAPEASISDAAGRPGLIILRSFGKFFGLPGLRLGFALAPLPFARRIRIALGAWAVSGPALEVGAQAMADIGWIEGMRVRLAEEAAQFDEMLAAADLSIAGGTHLFRLVATEHASELFAHLARRHVLTRPFDYCPNWLRLGLPKGGRHLGRLAEALSG